jgi:hypothetical protein
VTAAVNRRKNAIGCVRREPTAYDRVYEGVLTALDRAAPLSAKQRRQLYGEVMAELEQREADLDEQERAS